MWSIFLSGLATALSLLIVDLIVPGVSLNTFADAAIAAIAVGVVNAFIKPVLQIISIPVTILSLGGFALVVNGICFWLASLVVSGFHVSNILGFLFGPIVLSLVSAALGNYLANHAPAFMRDRSDLSTTDSTS